MAATSEPFSESGKLTRRGRERAQEDQTYHSVIVKRVDARTRAKTSINELLRA